jgi:hypothetical protein
MGESAGVGAPEQVVQQRCSVHTDRPAAGRCAACERPACLACSIPVRGRVLCRECAAREVGVPAPVTPAPGPVSRRPDVASGVLLLASLIATTLPWHGSGTLTSPFSAWAARDLWSFLACLCLSGGALAALGPILLGRGPSRRASLASTFLAAIAAVATAWTLIGAPDYFSPTPAPFIALGGAVAATAVGAVGRRRFRR